MKLVESSAVECLFSSKGENPHGYIGGRDRKKDRKDIEERMINKVRKKSRMMGKAEYKKKEREIII